MKLEFLSVEVRNFLTYGNTPFKFEFNKGINLIKGRNGVGKSSIINAVLFGLFGRISKDVKKNDIVNWKNDKNCEVVLILKKQDSIIKIHRGIKPNILNVYIDEIEIPSLSDVRDFQKQIENDILGFDYKSNLIYHNPNNDVSLIDSSKPQKRNLIEQLFDLKYFSELDKKVNVSIRDVELNKNTIDTNITYQNKTINSLETELTNIIIPSISTNEIEQLQKKLKSFNIDTDKLTEYNQKKQNLLDSLNKIKEEKLSNNITLLDSKKTSFLERLQTIGNIEEKNQKYRFVSDQLKNLTSFSEDKKNKVKEKIEEIKNDISEIEIKNSEYNTEKRLLNKELKELNSSPLKGKTKCPTCGQEIDASSLNTHIDDIKEKINKIELISYTELKDELNKYNKMLSIIDDKLKQKNNYEKELLSLSSIEKEQKEIEHINTNIKELNKQIEIEQNKVKELNEQIEEINKDISSVEEDILEIENDINKYNKIEQELKDKQNEYKIKEIERNTLLEKQKEIKQKIKNEQKELNTNKEELDKLVEKMEYLKYIKLVLKDDNVKKYAISNIIPYINKFTNEYLSEVGFNFYVTIDNWLDCIIKGPGRKECDSNCLSGGELKSVDLALKFAIMETLSLRSDIYPDILFLDEILDSSIDNSVLLSMIDIIKAKQVKDDMKIYIISHRNELKDIEFSNCYNVEKTNEFSKLQEE